MDDIKFSKNIEHENELNLKRMLQIQNPKKKSEKVKSKDKNIDNEDIKSKDDESKTLQNLKMTLNY